LRGVSLYFSLADRLRDLTIELSKDILVCTLLGTTNGALALEN